MIFFTWNFRFVCLPCSLKKVNKLLRNILVMLLPKTAKNSQKQPKTTKNKVTKMGWKAQNLAFLEIEKSLCPTSSAWFILVAPIKGLSSISTGLICRVAGRKLSWMFRTVWQKLSRFQLANFFQLFRVRARLYYAYYYPICILSINMIFSSCFQIKYGCS